MSKVGRKWVVTLEEGKSAENSLYVVEGMQFDRGYIFPYFVTDSGKTSIEYESCKLLVDKKITNARDLINVLEDAIRGGYPILIIAEDIDHEALATLVVNKLRGALKIYALKAPGFGERKSQYLDDIAILTGGSHRQEANFWGRHSYHEIFISYFLGRHSIHVFLFILYFSSVDTV